MTGEYAVIHGALSIALPTKLGQRMTIKNARGSDLIWEALDQNGDVWFEAQMSLYDFSAIKTSDPVISKQLKKILRSAVRGNSEFLSTWSGFKVETQLQFPREWGLGSSSTLISTVAQWAEINPFHLYFDLYNGSGYDVACAEADDAIEYQLGEDNLHFHEIDFYPSFANKLFFVYQGKKQDSESSLKIHGRKFKNKKDVIDKISEISTEISQLKSFNKFTELLEQHESIISDTIGVPTLKESEYKNFSGTIKSLGAWGGDFLLAASDQGEKYVQKYFNSKGMDVIFPYDKLIHRST